MFERLESLIVSGKQPVGERLASIDSWVRQLGTSRATVQAAMDQLEDRGYVVKKHGSGTYVADRQRGLTLNDLAVLCIEAQAHVWGQLGAMTARALAGRGALVSVIDTSPGQGCEELIRRAARGGARTFLVHGHRHFPFHVFEDPALRNAAVVGLVDWETALPISNLVGVLSDHAAGGRLLADYLHRRGHRRALAIGPTLMTAMMLTGPQHGPDSIPQYHFRRRWQQLGGTLDIVTLEDSPHAVESPSPAAQREILQHLTSPNPPTAIYGLLDPVAVAAQKLIRQKIPRRAASFECVGYYDTHWSAVADITSVNLNLPHLAQAVARVLEAILAGRKIRNTRILVPPQLVIRGQR